MPCYRCDLRQVDPDRGQSPWKRGVKSGAQVLICPACQGSFDWMAELDQCSVCGGVHLLRRLGEVECRDCGMVCDPADAGVGGGAVGGAGVGGAGVSAGGAGGGPGGPGGGDGGRTESGHAPGSLADDVERALERVLGRSRRTAGIR
jgi:hypothetical protein